MGEMMVGAERENISLVLIRPSIITSTFKEPFPGWTEGIRLDYQIFYQFHYKYRFMIVFVLQIIFLTKFQFYL